VLIYDVSRLVQKKSENQQIGLFGVDLIVVVQKHK